MMIAPVPPPLSAGLCASCRNARILASQTGSTFYRCRLAATDPRYPRYPQLPVLRCAGFAERTTSA